MINNWGRLKQNCPLNISDLCDIGWVLQMEIEIIKRSSKMDDVFLVKSKLNRLIKRFLGVISDTNGTEKEDKEVEHEFREAYARILGNIDKKEDEMKTKANVISTVAIPLYISEIESILNGDVYDPIARASELYPKDKKMFVLKAFELVNKSAQVFGGETRFRPTKKAKEPSMIDMAQAIPMTAEEMAKPEGRQMLADRFDRNFAMDEFRKSDEMFKRHD